MRLALPVLLLLLTAGSARADWAPDETVRTVLARGGVHVDVRPDGSGVSGVVRGAVEIDAPPQVVWNTILDCRRAGRMAPSVKSCRIISRDPAGRWDVREMTVRWNNLVPTFRTVFRSEFEPLTSINFRCTAGDVRYCKGEWRIIPLAGDRALVTYENRASSPFPAPAIVARAAMRKDVADALRALRREAESVQRQG
ncbi:MAG: SRPBCC family protein [Caulobacter sp.]|nr:SRPBCC family protein [Caulobacter sp.]